MLKISKFIAAIAAGLFFTSSAMAFTPANTPVFVGSFNVFDGPVWTSNPQVYSGLDAAALLFGGSASDYAISVVNSNDPTTITHTAWLDGWGDTTYLFTAAPETYKLSSRGDGGYDQSPAFSAYVCDHANCIAYGNPINSGSAGNYTNYVWRVAAVPEPSSYALMFAGLVAVGAIARRRKN